MRKLLLAIPETFWWLCVIALLLFLWTSSSQAHYMPPALFSWQDKVEHFAYFALWGGCFFMALSRRERPLSLTTRMLLTIAFCAANGALDEWHQTFTPNRSGNDLYDWIADLSGGCFAAAVGALLLREAPVRSAS